MSTATPAGRSARVRWITAASIGAVGLAAALAIAANVGILDASGDNGVGTLSATGEPVATTQIVAAAPSTSLLVAGASAAGTQQFAVDAAGTVTVAAVDAGIRLQQVDASSGWTWTLAQPADNQLTVTFTDGTRTLDFVAIGRTDGTVDASVTEPVAAPAASGGGGESHHDDGEEHEGGEDDD